MRLCEYDIYDVGLANLELGRRCRAKGGKGNVRHDWELSGLEIEAVSYLFVPSAGGAYTLTLPPLDYYIPLIPIDGPSFGINS